MSGIGTPTNATVHRTAPRWVTAPPQHHPPPTAAAATTAATTLDTQLQHQQPRSIPNTHTPSISSHTSAPPRPTPRPQATIDSTKSHHANHDAPIVTPSDSKHPPPPQRAPQSAPATTTSYIAGPLPAALSTRMWRAPNAQAAVSASTHANGSTSHVASSSTPVVKQSKLAPSTTVSAARPGIESEGEATSPVSSDPPRSAVVQPSGPASSLPPRAVSAGLPKPVRPRMSTATATPPPQRSTTPSSSRLRASSELQQSEPWSDTLDSSSVAGEGSAEPSSKKKKKKKAPRRGWKGWAIEVVDEHGNKSIRSPSPEPEPPADAPRRGRGRPRKLPLADGEESKPDTASTDAQTQGEPSTATETPLDDGEMDSTPLEDEADTPTQASTFSRQQKTHREANRAAEAKAAPMKAARPAKRAREPSPDHAASSKRQRSRPSTPAQATAPLSESKREPSQPNRGSKPRRSEPGPNTANGNSRRASSRSARSSEGGPAQDTSSRLDDITANLSPAPQSSMRSTHPARHVASTSTSDGKRQGTLDAFLVADGKTPAKAPRVGMGLVYPSPPESDERREPLPRGESDEPRLLNNLPDVDDEARFIIQSASKERAHRERQEKAAPREPPAQKLDGESDPRYRAKEELNEQLKRNEEEKRRRKGQVNVQVPSRRGSRDRGLRGREFQDHEWSAVLRDRGSADSWEDGPEKLSAREVPRERVDLSPRHDPRDIRDPRDRDPRDVRANGHHPPPHMMPHQPPPHDLRYYPPPYAYSPGYYPPYHAPPQHMHPSQFPIYPPHMMPIDGHRHVPPPHDGRPSRNGDGDWARSGRRVSVDPRDHERVGRPMGPIPPGVPTQPHHPAAPAAAPSRQPGTVPPYARAGPSDRVVSEVGVAPRPPTGWTSGRPGYTDVVPTPFPTGRPYQPPEPRPPNMPPNVPTLVLAPGGNEYPPCSDRHEMALSKAYAEGADGLDPSLEENARGFVENVKNNLRTLVSTYFTEPRASRDAFLERIGRDLTSFGWELTDSSDGALYSRASEPETVSSHERSRSSGRSYSPRRDI